MAPTICHDHQMVFHQIRHLRSPDIAMPQTTVNQQNRIASAVGGVIHLNAIDCGHPRTDCGWHCGGFGNGHPTIFGKGRRCDKGNQSKGEWAHGMAPDMQNPIVAAGLAACQRFAILPPRAGWCGLFRQFPQSRRTTRRETADNPAKTQSGPHPDTGTGRFPPEQHAAARWGDHNFAR